MKKCSLHFAGISIAMSFLCMMPFFGHAQQTGTTSQVNKEKKSSALSENEEEEEEEGSAEAAIEHSNSAWYKAMQKKNVNYVKVKKLYDNYFKKHPQENSKPRQRFEDWLKNQAFYLDKKGRVQAPPAINYNAIQKPLAIPWATATDTMAGDWHMLGPRNSYQSGYSSNDNRGGYVNCVRIDPTNPNKLFVSFQTGGLWVSNDGGIVWQLTDKNLPGKAYMDIDVCKADNNYVYAISYGGAVIKSTDGGLTWASTFLNSTNYPGVNAYDIAVSPINPNLVLARWGTTIYRTTDGGTTWTSILTGLKNYSPTDGAGSRSEVLDFHAASDSVVYHLDRSDNQSYVTLYRSGNSGASFTNLGNISIPAGATGATRTNAAKLLSASNNADALYIAMGSHDRNAENTNDINHTIHLIKVNSTTGVNLLTRVNMIAAGFSSGDLAMDINNDNILVHGAYGPTKSNYSTNNGATFTVSTTTVHADLRSLCIVSGKVLLGTDGEATYSSNGGITYTNLTTTISNHELWGFGGSHKTGLLGAGLNHGPLMIREHEGLGGWYNAMGADQQNTDVNPLDDKYLYSRGYATYHVVRTGPHTMNSGADQQEIDPGREDCYNNMTFHPNLYYTFITHHGGVKPANNPNLALWKKSLIRSDNNGVTINKIIKTFDTDVRREVICMTDTSRIYVMEGLSNNKLWKTTDAGTTWIEITPSTAVTGTGVRNISDVVVSDVNANEIWVTYSGVQNTCKVLHSIDGGLTYTNLTTAALTTWPVTRMIFQRGTNGGVYVGNKAGVFYRNNSMNEWALIGNGLPMVDVRFMFINYFNGKLLIGTNRGAWDHDLYELTAPKAQISASKNKIVCSGSIRFADYSVLHNDAQTSYSWSFPGGSPANSTEENPLVNYSVSGNYDVTLTVTDQFGTSTQTLTNFINVDCSAYTDCGNPADIPSENMSVVYADSQDPNEPAIRAIDGNINSIWHTKYTGGSDPYPHELQLDLGRIYSVSKLKYLPRQSGTNGYIANYEIYVSNNTVNWGAAVATGTFANNATEKIVSFAAKAGRYIRFKALSPISAGSAWASAAEIKVTGCVLPNVGPAVSISSPANNTSFNTLANVTINADATDSDGSVAKVEFYQGSTKLGEDLTAPYSFSWNNVATGSYAITAKATDNEGATTTSAVVNITVTNPAPTIAITSPVNNTSFVAPAAVTINATTSDANGSVTKVEFYQGSTLLGEDLTAPYSFSWNNVATGLYAITAKAIDNEGANTTAAVINITVTNPAPTVAVTSPVNNTSFTAPASVTINATASDANGSVTKVEFFQGSTLLGEDLTAPYSFSWNNVASGSYAITAKATDNQNASTTSAAVNVMVNDPISVLVNPVADAYVRNGTYASNNYGTATTLSVKSDGTSYYRESFLRFDYTAYTATTVNNAKLRLHVSSVNTAASRVISVYAITNATWGETAVNYSNRPTESGTLIGTITVTNASGLWYELDVTSYINNQVIAGNKIVSFRLINAGAMSSNNDVNFSSRETAANKPELIINESSLGIPNMVVDNSTSTSILSKAEVFPNPARGVTTLQFSSNRSGNAGLSLTSSNGRIIWQKTIAVIVGSNQSSFDVRSLTPGTYLLRLQNGNDRMIKKIIVTQ